MQVRVETENFRVEREDLRLAVDKLRGEGTDTKLEIQSLKKMEKLIKVITLHVEVIQLDRLQLQLIFSQCWSVS